jgi:hypothetical protein
MSPVIVVGGIGNVAAAIADARLDHAGHLSDQVLHPPEAAACQNRPFRLLCHVTTSQLSIARRSKLGTGYQGRRVPVVVAER